MLLCDIYGSDYNDIELELDVRKWPAWMMVQSDGRWNDQLINATASIILKEDWHQIVIFYDAIHGKFIMKSETRNICSRI